MSDFSVLKTCIQHAEVGHSTKPCHKACGRLSEKQTKENLNKYLCLKRNDGIAFDLNGFICREKKRLSYFVDSLFYRFVEFI